MHGKGTKEVLAAARARHPTMLVDPVEHGRCRDLRGQERQAVGILAHLRSPEHEAGAHGREHRKPIRAGQ